MIKFSGIEDEKMVTYIREHPLLWNMADTHFKNATKKEAAWQEIGAMLSRPAEDCRVRWRHIKDYYKRSRNDSNKKGVRGGGGKKTRGSAKYIHNLQFLDAVLEAQLDSHNMIISNLRNNVEHPEHSMEESADLNIDDEVNDISDDGDAPQSKRVKKERASNEELDFTRLLEHGEGQELVKSVEQPRAKNEEDEMDLFFRTMAATAKKFSPELRRQAKIKVFNVISEIEGVHQNCTSSFPHDSNNYTRPSTSAQRSQSSDRSNFGASSLADNKLQSSHTSGGIQR